MRTLPTEHAAAVDQHDTAFQDALVSADIEDDEIIFRIHGNHVTFKADGQRNGLFVTDQIIDFGLQPLVFAQEQFVFFDERIPLLAGTLQVHDRCLHLIGA